MKKLIVPIILSALIICAANAAAADLKTVDISLNSTDGVFRMGEKAVVTASVQKGGNPRMTMWVLENGNRILEKEIKLSTRPKAIYERVCDHNCGVQVYLKETGGDGKDNLGIGFVVAPEEFSPGYPCPDDFKEFWDAQLSAMRAADPVVRMEPVPVEGKDAEDFVCYSLEISMHEGHPARGYLAMPKNAKPGSLPIVLFLHGAGVAAKGCRSRVSTAIEYAKMGGGAIAADINAHGMYNDRPQKYYDDLEKGELKDYRMIPPQGKDKFYYRLMYLRDVRALDFMCTLPEWDGRHVLVTGASQGGGQSCGVAGLDSRVTAIVPIVPGMSDEGAALVRPCGWQKHFRQMTGDPMVANYYPYYDSANFLRFTKARIRMEVGLIDETCAPEGMFAAFNVAVSPDKEIVPCPYRRHTINSGSRHYARWKEEIQPGRVKFIEEALKQ